MPELTVSVRMRKKNWTFVEHEVLALAKDSLGLVKSSSLCNADNIPLSRKDIVLVFPTQIYLELFKFALTINASLDEVEIDEQNKGSLS